MFGENLKEIRNNKNLSQEELAEILNISRQAISRWEANQGYPEVEMLLKLADVLDCSLDYLMYGKSRAKTDNNSIEREITIYSPTEKSVTVCTAVQASAEFKSKDQPKYALIGVTGRTRFEETRRILGWYETEEAISAEIESIYNSIIKGAQNYTLKYACNVSKSWNKIKIIK